MTRKRPVLWRLKSRNGKTHYIPAKSKEKALHRCDDKDIISIEQVKI